MRKTFLPLFLVLLPVLPVLAFARSYEVTELPYSDTTTIDRPTAIALSVLTDERILQGNPDGTFRPYRYLNRAEFVKIIMGIRGDELVEPPRWFPDVPPQEWYAPFVCRAKQLGIVRGNPVAGVPVSKWLFAPGRTVNYAEAVKILVELYDIPFTQTSRWYDGYLLAAQSRDLDLTDHAAGDLLTRAAMARLVTGFLAFDRGELDELRDAERGSSSSSSSTSSSSSSSSTSSSSSSSSAGAVYDSYGSTVIRPQFLLLGEVSPVVGAANIFLEAEAMDTTKITINLMSQASVVESFLVFDQEKRLLGRATLDGSQGDKTYVLRLQPGTLIIPRREETGFYVRADLRSEDEGGTSQTVVEINNFLVEGTGVWSNDAYSKVSSDDFPGFETARSTLTSVTNAGQQEETLIAGPDRVIGAFRFEGRVSDSSAALDLTELTFDLTRTSGVTLSNVRLGLRGFPDRMNCTLTSSQIICSNIDNLFGSLEGGAKILEVRADVVVASGIEGNETLMLSLGTPGSILDPGSIEWNDGTSDFTWVAFDSPVARGTRYVR